MDAQEFELNETLRTTAAPGLPPSTAEAETQPLADRRRRQPVAAGAGAVVVALGAVVWFSNSSVGSSGGLPPVSGGTTARATTAGAAGLILVAVLAAITVAGAWSARRTTEPWLTWCAALLPLTLALQYAVWLWNAWPRAPWLTTPGVVLTLLPLLLALGAAVGLPGPGAVRRIPVVVTVTSVALTASVVFALPAAAMRLWWGFALSSRAFTMAALAVAVVLVVLVVGWIRRGDATTQPRPTRRLQVLGTLALVALVSSLPWLYNERVSPGSPVALALAGQVVLLLMPAVFIVLAPERRSARRIIVTAAATQLVILVDWPVAAAFWRLPRPSLILGLAGFVLAGALLLAAAALVAVPRAESSPDGSGKHTA